MTRHDVQPTDLEHLMKNALSRVAVGAFAHGIGLSAHLDARLPVRLTGNAAAVTDYLRQGLARTIEANRTSKVALALWHEAGDAGDRIVLEACRSLDGQGRAAPPLADLWALPLDGARAEPTPHRQDARGESVLVTLPLGPAANAPLLADSWRPAFQGRYMLRVGDPLLDAQRLEAAFAALGLGIGIALSPEAALELARRRADAGQRLDLLLIDGHAHGEAAAEIARAFRADSRLAGALIGLAGAGPGGAQPDEDTRLFDAVRPELWPCRPMIEIFRDLIEARAAAENKRPAARPGASLVPDLAGRRLLVAEDVETNQVLLRAILEPTGATIETVSGGETVLERHATEPADLIVMDLQMPGMGGIAATRCLRALPAPAGAVPIIALTAYSREPDRQRAIAAGMDAYLAKPVVVSEVYDVLHRLLATEPAPAEPSLGQR